MIDRFLRAIKAPTATKNTTTATTIPIITGNRIFFFRRWGAKIGEGLSVVGGGVGGGVGEVEAEGLVVGEEEAEGLIVICEVEGDDRIVVVVLASVDDIDVELF